MSDGCRGQLSAQGNLYVNRSGDRRFRGHRRHQMTCCFGKVAALAPRNPFHLPSEKMAHIHDSLLFIHRFVCQPAVSEPRANGSPPAERNKKK